MEWREKRDRLKSKDSKQSFDFLLRRHNDYLIKKSELSKQIRSLSAKFKHTQKLIDHLEYMMNQVIENDEFD